MPDMLRQKRETPTEFIHILLTTQYTHTTKHIISVDLTIVFFIFKGRINIFISSQGKLFKD